jgi:hypothetical protein
LWHHAHRVAHGLGSGVNASATTAPAASYSSSYQESKYGSGNQRAGRTHHPNGSRSSVPSPPSSTPTYCCRYREPIVRVTRNRRVTPAALTSVIVGAPRTRANVAVPPPYPTRTPPWSPRTAPASPTRRFIAACRLFRHRPYFSA